MATIATRTETAAILTDALGIDADTAALWAGAFQRVAASDTTDPIGDLRTELDKVTDGFTALATAAARSMERTGGAEEFARDLDLHARLTN